MFTVLDTNLWWRHLSGGNANAFLMMHAYAKRYLPKCFFFFIFYTLSSIFWIVSYFSIQINVCTYLNSIKLCLRQHSHWVHKKSSSLFVQNFFVEPTLFDLSKDCFDKPKDQNSKFALRWTLILNLHLRVIRFCGWLQFAELCPGHNFRGPICPCSRKKADVTITFVLCAFSLILGIVFFFLIILLR